jgi:hypothetical protein
MLKRQWDRVAAWVLIAVGLLALLLGYVGISGTPRRFRPWRRRHAVGIGRRARRVA